MVKQRLSAQDMESGKGDYSWCFGVWAEGLVLWVLGDGGSHFQGLNSTAVIEGECGGGQYHILKH